MALAQVKEVVYLQTDPGMNFIGRILRNLTTEKLRAPRPIAGGELNLHLFIELDQAFAAFVEGVGQKPFFKPAKGEPDSTPALTSFLCTSEARRIFAGGRDTFRRLARGEEALAFPNFRAQPDALSNEELLAERSGFERYATEIGKRATPHNL
jgi:hypothetical protein